ncbi:MAG: hypothetical protein K2X66_09725 [Cyanobacteria bacterium]|nr:hypothetical protein [Cyanobacteriota bacterium]
MQLDPAFRKALQSYGKVHDFPVIVEYENGEFDSLPSAALKDILYTGEAYEVIYALRDIDFLTNGQSPQEASEALTDYEVTNFLKALKIQSVFQD